jgi:hypothetical protein
MRGNTDSWISYDLVSSTIQGGVKVAGRPYTSSVFCGSIPAFEVDRARIGAEQGNG